MAGDRIGRLEKLKNTLENYKGIKKIIPVENILQVYFENTGFNAAELNRYCFEQGVLLNFIQTRKKSLESEFIELTNNVSN